MISYYYYYFGNQDNWFGLNFKRLPFVNQNGAFSV